MPVFEDWLKSPLSIINNLYASDPSNFEQKLQEYFDNKLKTEKSYLSIPSINEVPIHELSPNCLVRYRCMIQDTFDPVYFNGIHQLKHKKTGEVVNLTVKYKETLEQWDGYEPVNEKENALGDGLMDTAQETLFQRVTLYCVPIPGETEWVKNVYKTNNSSGLILNGSSSSTSNRPAKRGIDNDDSDTAEPLVDSSNLTKPNQIEHNEEATKEKNQFTRTICKICFKSKEPVAENESSKALTSKKTKTDECDDSKSSNSTLEFNLNFPLSCSNEAGVPCLVKTYENFDNFKLNDTYEFIGILSQDPALAYQYDEHSDGLQAVSQQLYQQQQDEIMAESFKLNLQENNSMETEQSGANNTASRAASAYCYCKDEDRFKFLKNPKTILSSFPPSLVPRLHCIKAFNLTHNNPLIPRSWGLTENGEAKKKADNAETNAFWNEQYKNFLIQLNRETNPKLDLPLTDARIHLISLRKEIVNFFQEILLGDGLAAEYLLMHLLSSVFMRRDVTILGKFSLNITNIPQCLAVPNQNQENNPVPAKINNLKDNRTFSTCFYNILKQFLTMSYMFPLSIDSLNKSNLIPNKDYNKDRLITGMLQLPNNFSLILDETVLNAGELTPKGLLNINSLKDIIRWQKINYDFSYHQQEFQTNMRILILSETKSILPFDAQLKLKANVEHFDADKYINYTNELISRIGSSLFNNIRKYFSILSQIDYKLNEPMQKIVEDDIVKLRQTTETNGATGQNEKISVEDLHLLLVVARLQSVSYGQSELCVSEWNRAKQLELERVKNRI